MHESSFFMTSKRSRLPRWEQFIIDLLHEKSLLYTCGKLSFLGFYITSKSVAYPMCSFWWNFLENWIFSSFYERCMHICKKGEFFMTKKSKKWFPTTKMIYKRYLTLEMWSLHLYESRILTAWINSSKMSVNNADFHTKCSWIFSLKLLC